MNRRRKPMAVRKPIPMTWENANRIHQAVMVIIFLGRVIVGIIAVFAFLALIVAMLGADLIFLPE